MNNPESPMEFQELGMSEEDYDAAVAVGIDPALATKMDRDIVAKKEVIAQLGLRDDASQDDIRKAIRDKYNSIKASGNNQIN